jgi:NADP-dependent 3-hydroxy acid dehydrogenase YdfG
LDRADKLDHFSGGSFWVAQLRAPETKSLWQEEAVSGKLEGRVAIITGASAGIGRASARALAQSGARLVLTARRQDRLDELVDYAQACGTQAISVVGDAREEATAVAVAEAARTTFGRADILINNVGIGNYKTLVDTSLENYVEMMDTNVRTTFLFTRHVVPMMIQQRDGLVLFISSMAGVYGFPGEAVYCATKFAQVGFAQGLDKELRPHGIKVGTICPGGVKTEFALGKGRTEESVEQSAMLEDEDVAAAVLFACTQSKGSRIIQVQMRTMAESLT